MIELDILKEIKDIKVFFDVGARISDNREISWDITDYLKIHPKAQYHLFEPNPEFFNELKEKVGNKENVYLNNYGLGDVEGEFKYSDPIQTFESGDAPFSNPQRVLPIKTLDWYIKEHGIKQIDFLKIDTEGYDFKVLMGGLEAIKICRYIQYEHWDNKIQFYELLNKDFWMRDIGQRNILCKR